MKHYEVIYWMEKGEMLYQLKKYTYANSEKEAIERVKKYISNYANISNYNDFEAYEV